jgi:hypothetical protein
MNTLEMLKSPFSKSELKWRQGRGGMQLAYIDARCAMKRLDDVVGIDGWQDSYKSLDGRTVCELSLKINGVWITKTDGAGDTNIEGEKGGLSDAFKRAAVKFGVGRYLYYVPNQVNTFDDLPEQLKPSNKRINREELQASLAAIVDGIAADEDRSSVDECYNELEPHEQMWVWNILSTKQKDYIRNNNQEAA